jgi:hypothetical protein
MSEDSDRRFPIDKTRYYQSVGRLLPHRIGQIIKESGYTAKNGYKIWINPNQSNDVDFKIYFNDNLVLVGEVLNWSIKSWLSEKRKSCIIKNLTIYNCKRVLIYTVFSNEYLLKDFSSYGISLVKLGFQLLPEYFYSFYANKNQIEYRKVDSRETIDCIRSTIIQHLQSSRIEIVPFEISELTVTDL